MKERFVLFQLLSDIFCSPCITLMYERVVKNAKAFRLTDALMVATSNLLELIFVVCEYLPALTTWKWGKVMLVSS